MLENLYPTAGLLGLIIVFGFWVSRAGKPYNSILFNIHKLLALGAVVLTAVRLFSVNPFATFSGASLALIFVAALSVIGIFATGAAMSIQAEVKPLFQWVHGILMVIASGSLVASLLLLQSA
jgi:hypothetical protein